MRNKSATADFYINGLGFEQAGGDYPDYLMVKRDDIELHFFLFKEIDPLQNYGQVYIRTNNIQEFILLYKTRILKHLHLNINPGCRLNFLYLTQITTCLLSGRG
jgi:hypothetical protein